MEEDVEIELLLKANEELLVSDSTRSNENENNADKLYVQNMLYIGEDSNEETFPIQEPCTETATHNTNDAVNYSDEVQELLDDHIVSAMALQSHSGIENDISDYESDEGNQFLNKIISQNVQGRGTIMDHVKKLIGSKSSQINSSAINALTSAYQLIVEREQLLKKLEHKFQEKLYLIEENIQNTRENITSLNVQPNVGTNKKWEPSLTKSFFKSFGAPYFKDSFGFPAPPNEDHIAKLQTDQRSVMFVEPPCYWTKDHQEKLVDAIKETLVSEKTDKLIKQINKLKSFLSSEYDKELQTKIAKNQKELTDLKTKSFEELISDENQDREYDWMKYSASVFEGEHSPDECQQFWNTYLNPSISKSNWECEEDTKLLEIAEKMEFHDWDSIAKSLGTNRTGYQCFVHFQTRLNGVQDYNKGKWTKEEDDRLMNVINASRIGNFIPWTKVASHMEGRTHVQIYNRFKNCLDPRLVKGKFTKGEDLLIAAGVEVFGCSYKELSSLLINRSPGQIRERYERYILPQTRNVGSWTLEEDKRLMELVNRYGEQNWSAISKEMKVRSRTQIRQRYRFIQRNMKTKDGWTIANTKRRNVHKSDKSLEHTKKNVEKIKKEIDEIEQSFHLEKIEKDTFRIEKLKELRDKILTQNYKVERKSRVWEESGHFSKCVKEFFKHNQMKPPDSTKICKVKDYKYHFNELIFLARNLGYELQIPCEEGEILNNPRLGNKLQNVLLESIKKPTDPSLACTTDSLPIPNCINIDYTPPEVDTSIVMNAQWFVPFMEVSRLNFSELFKPTIFDYSCGMHQDIWESTLKQSTEINLTPIANSTHESPSSARQQLFNIPPNLLTTIGYKSALLSRGRLKQDCKERKRECLSKGFNFNVAKGIGINNHLDRFQETLFMLFTGPTALSLCNVPTNSGNTNSPQTVFHLKRNSTNKKFVTDKETTSKQDIKVVKNDKNKKHKKDNSKQKFIKTYRGFTYQRKMQIEHLITDVKETTCPDLCTDIAADDPCCKSVRTKKLRSNDENKSPVSDFQTKNNTQLSKNYKLYLNKVEACKKTVQLTDKLKSPKSPSFRDVTESKEVANLAISKTYRRQQKRTIESGDICVPRKKSNNGLTEEISDKCEVK